MIAFLVEAMGHKKFIQTRSALNYIYTHTRWWLPVGHGPDLYLFAFCMKLCYTANLEIGITYLLVSSSMRLTCYTYTCIICLSEATVLIHTMMIVLPVHTCRVAMSR